MHLNELSAATNSETILQSRLIPQQFQTISYSSITMFLFEYDLLKFEEVGSKQLKFSTTHEY